MAPSGERNDGSHLCTGQQARAHLLRHAVRPRGVRREGRPGQEVPAPELRDAGLSGHTVNPASSATLAMGLIDHPGQPGALPLRATPITLPAAQPAACSVWRRSDADSMSARDNHDPTQIPDIRLQVSLSASPHRSGLCRCGGVHIGRVRAQPAGSQRFHAFVLRCRWYSRCPTKTANRAMVAMNAQNDELRLTNGPTMAARTTSKSVTTHSAALRRTGLETILQPHRGHR